MTTSERKLYEIPGQFECSGGFIGGYFTPRDNLERVRNYEIYEDDCFVASYPKTGTTLTQETVFLIYNDGNEEAAKSTPIHKRFPYFETDECLPLVKNLPRPRLIKTHLPFDMIPKQATEKDVKIIYVMRNPKDTLVSYFHFYKSCKSFANFPGTWDEFFQLFLHKKLFCGDFYDHVISWWNERHRDNILYLKYEDMITDPKSNIAKISAFLGKTLTVDQVDNIIEQTSFKTMRDNPLTNYSQTNYQNNDIHPFVRKGKIGDWKNFFTAEQSEIMDKINAERLEGIDIDFQFE